jgi:hypothetical protein
MKVGGQNTPSPLGHSIRCFQLQGQTLGPEASDKKCGQSITSLGTHQQIMECHGVDMHLSLDSHATSHCHSYTSDNPNQETGMNKPSAEIERFIPVFNQKNCQNRQSSCGLFRVVDELKALVGVAKVLAFLWRYLCKPLVRENSSTCMAHSLTNITLQTPDIK